MPWNLEMQQRWKHWAELSYWAAVPRCLHLLVREAERGVSKFFPSVKYVYCQFSLQKVGQGSPRRPMDSRYSVWMLVKDEWLGKGKWSVTRKRQEMDSKWNTRYQCEVNPTRIKANQQNWARTTLTKTGQKRSHVHSLEHWDENEALQEREDEQGEQHLSMFACL